MKVNLTEENLKDLKQLLIILKAGKDSLINYVIKESLSLVSNDLKGIPDKFKDVIKKQIAKDLKKKH